MQRKILFLDSAHPLLGEGLEQMGFSCDYAYDWNEDRIRDNLGAYTGVIIRSKLKFTKELIDKGPHLKFIARVGSGMENIDTHYAQSKGIDCLHAPEGNRIAVGEHTLGMLLCLFNSICRADREVRSGKWLREQNRGTEISGKTIGIIGFGNTGSAFAGCLSGFDCDILAYDKFKKGFGTDRIRETDLDFLFNNAHVISIHLPLTAETGYFVNDLFLSRFKKPIVLINTSRGPIVQTEDLVKNMKTGKVTGACLDVLEYESVSFENLDNSQLPEAFQYLIKSDRVVLSPHIAGWTEESKIKMAQVLLGKIQRSTS